jgi:SAM-dependent methyltransferase
MNNNKIDKLPSPLQDDKYTLLHEGIYDSPEISVYINENKDFSFLYPYPVVDYENYKPRVDQLNLSKYKQGGSILERRFQKINNLIKKKKSILEIGSADGAFLNLIHKYFPELSCYSVEPDLSTSTCRDKLSYLVQYEGLSEVIQDKVKVDVVALFHVFEHIKKPNNFLKNIRKIIAPDGIVIIEVPCLMDPLLSVYHSSSYEKFYFQCQHPFVYSEKSLCRVLEYEGFDIEQVIYHQRYGIENHLQWLSKDRPGGSLIYKEMFKNIDKEYRNIIELEGKTDSIIVVCKVNK